jgi:adenylate cyclase
MTAKVLVVDDEPDLEQLIRQLFRRELRQGDLGFVFAANGVQALNRLQNDPELDLVLSDINMPEMDGLTLLGHLPKLKRPTRAVIVSAYGDMDNIRTAMNRGAFESALRARDAAERARINLSRYFPPNMVELLAGTEEPFDAAREQPVAVLFADIVGFSQFCASRPPERVFALLRDFLGYMADTVFENGGTLDKFIGDGIMATFGTPFSGEHDASNAVRCALAMRRDMEAFNQRRVERGLDAIRIGVGVHYGPALLGNVGNAQRMEFAVVGSTVNIASRLEDLARPLEATIVLSQSVVDAVGAEASDGAALVMPFEPRGPHELRGLDIRVPVWTMA